MENCPFCGNKPKYSNNTPNKVGCVNRDCVILGILMSKEEWSKRSCVKQTEVENLIIELEKVEKIYQEKKDNSNVQSFTDFYNARLIIVQEHLFMLRWFNNPVITFLHHWENTEWLNQQESLHYK